MKNIIAGAAVGLSAPLGAFAWRLAFTQKAFLRKTLREEWRGYRPFYTYITVASVLGFSLFSRVLKNRGSKFRIEVESMKSTFDNVHLQAITDGLTGVYNHRYLQEKLASEIERYKRYKTPLTCLMVDIDNFKKVNDKHGHAFGDLVLITVARIIRENVRRVDLVGRYGGEEFLIVMSNTAAEVAFPIAERVRDAIQTYVYPLKEGKIRVTASLGMASLSKDHEDKASLLEAVDFALYEAKRRGKNQTRVWSREMIKEMAASS